MLILHWLGICIEKIYFFSPQMLGDCLINSHNNQVRIKQVHHLVLQEVQQGIILIVITSLCDWKDTRVRWILSKCLIIVLWLVSSNLDQCWRLSDVVLSRVKLGTALLGWMLNWHSQIMWSTAVPQYHTVHWFTLHSTTSQFNVRLSECV